MLKEQYVAATKDFCLRIQLNRSKALSQRRVNASVLQMQLNVGATIEP